MRNNIVPESKRGVRCTDCGPTVGTETVLNQGGLRCTNCGKFAEPCPCYCAKHELYWGRLTGYDYCPKCREYRRIEHERAEQAIVGHDMHPTVDAPRR
jgi:phage FluMu protein Com